MRLANQLQGGTAREEAIRDEMEKRLEQQQEQHRRREEELMNRILALEQMNAAPQTRQSLEPDQQCQSPSSTDGMEVDDTLQPPPAPVVRLPPPSADRHPRTSAHAP